MRVAPLSNAPKQATACTTVAQMILFVCSASSQRPLEHLVHRVQVTPSLVAINCPMDHPRQIDFLQIKPNLPLLSCRGTMWIACSKLGYVLCLLLHQALVCRRTEISTDYLTLLQTRPPFIPMSHNAAPPCGLNDRMLMLTIPLLWEDGICTSKQACLSPEGTMIARLAACVQRHQATAAPLVGAC